MRELVQKSPCITAAAQYLGPWGHFKSTPYLVLFKCLLLEGQRRLSGHSSMTLGSSSTTSRCRLGTCRCLNSEQRNSASIWHFLGHELSEHFVEVLERAHGLVPGSLLSAGRQTLTTRLPIAQALFLK